jgi:hypothetical protein
LLVNDQSSFYLPFSHVASACFIGSEGIVEVSLFGDHDKIILVGGAAGAAGTEETALQ